MATPSNSADIDAQMVDTAIAIADEVLADAAPSAHSNNSAANTTTRSSVATTASASAPASTSDYVTVIDDDKDGEDHVMGMDSPQQQGAHQQQHARYTDKTNDTRVTAASAAAPVANTMASASRSDAKYIHLPADGKFIRKKDNDHANIDPAIMTMSHRQAATHQPALNISKASDKDNNNTTAAAGPAAGPAAARDNKNASDNAAGKSRLDAHLETTDFWRLVDRHRQAAYALNAAVDAIEAFGSEIEARALTREEIGMTSDELDDDDDEDGGDGANKSSGGGSDGGRPMVMLKAKDRRMNELETSIERTRHSMWKLSAHVRLLSDKIQKSDDDGKVVNIEHDMYELLEGFINALTAKRGPDLAKWGKDGQELGAMLDDFKADMEWWNDGKDEEEE
ncbi:hypothetical protein UCDDS831_g02847 [Diplodia seriata]|uniref:Uncharacterized protein n=1 Tax=Diplodia seriata TaxID=420778 RepID=A0A0G2END4_9PEZI|nr:hypothetical protein UCDDS831_g02847 [Diplodia seriata]